MIDPRARLVVVMAVGVVAVTVETPAALLVLLGAALLLHLGVKGHPLFRRRYLSLFVAMFWGNIFSQSLFYQGLPRTPMVSIGAVHLYAEGFRYGLVQSLRFAAVGLAGLSMVFKTSTPQIIQALVFFRVPAGLAFLAATAMRTLPDLAQDWAEVRLARARRGRALWRRSPWNWLRTEVQMLQPVIARSIRRSASMAEAMEVRGFQPARQRVSWHDQSLGTTDVLVMGVTVGMTTALIAARLLYALYVYDIWWSPNFFELYRFVRMWL